MNDRYKHKLVNDLAWILKSPPLINSESNHIITPQQDWYDEIYENFQDHLEYLEKNPQQLEFFLQNKSNQRLGFYFENLWHYWLSHNPNYQLITDHLAIHHDGKTIGEFDFIVKDLKKSKIYHWELTVKYYLKSKKLWYGPNRKDRLDLKFDQLISHQTQLAKKLPAQEKLTQLKIHIDETWIISKGYLFYPYHDQLSDQQKIFSDHLKGYWSNQKEFIKKFSNQNFNWFILEKKNWLSENFNPPHKYLDLNLFKNEMIKKPLQLEGHNNHQMLRVFIVPDQWE